MYILFFAYRNTRAREKELRNSNIPFLIWVAKLWLYREILLTDLIRNLKAVELFCDKIFIVSLSFDVMFLTPFLRSEGCSSHCVFSVIVL